MPHLKFILVGEVLHQARYLESFTLTLAKEFEGNDLETILDRVGDFTRVRSRNLSDWVCLSNNKKVFDFSNEVFHVIFYGVPYDEEIGRIGFVSEKRCANKVVVQCRHGLTGIDVAKFHERRVILRFQNEGYAKIELYALRAGQVC